MSRVLCVDSDETMARLYRQVLPDCGLELSIATSGEALTQLDADSSRPDLVICELDMPHTPVLQLLQKSPVFAGDAAVPVIIITRCDSEELEVAAKRCGVARYLVKPVSPPLLAAAVTAVLRQRGIEVRRQPDRELLASRFAVESVISRRPNLAIYKARDTRRDGEPLVALQVMTLPKRRADFLAGIDAVSSLGLPGLVPLVDAGMLTGELGYVATDWVAGDALGNIVESYGALPESQVAFLGFELCRTLRRLHEAEVVHGAIDASRIMINEDGDVQLLWPRFGGPDWSMARVTVPEALALPPELLRGGTTATRAAGDVFALGAVLSYALRGAAPFTGAAPAIIGERQRRVYPPLRDEVRWNPHLARVIDGMMGFVPDARPAVVELMIDFGDIMMDETTVGRLSEETISEKISIEARHRH